MTYYTNDLTEKTAPADTDEIEIQETSGGTSKKITYARIKNELRFTVLSKSGSFSPSASDGSKAYYRCTGAGTITIPTLAAGGYTQGDELTLVNRDSGTKTFDTTGLTVNIPAGYTLGFNSTGSPITLVCVGATEWDAFGDMEVT